MVETILSTMHHAPEAQEGHTPRSRCDHKRAHHAACALLAAHESSNLANLRRPLVWAVPLLQSSRAARTRRPVKAVDISEHLRRHAVK
eukprot:3075764-Prymnesium_polylepis.1